MNCVQLARWLVFVLVPAAVFPQSAGYWRASGSRILDSATNPVRISGVNWYGFETTDEVVHGLWAQDYKTILSAIRTNGYNTVRIPFSNQMVENPAIPSNLSFYNGAGPINADLSGLNSLQILDKIISYAGQLGLRVILDNHRSEAGNSAEANGLWFTTAYPEAAWINDWLTLTNRYQGNSTVIGMDLRNEPHNATSGGACWGCGSANDWRLAAQRAGNAILAVNPNLLIFVEGTDCVNGDCTWWGGNLEGASAFPVVLNVSNHLVYSAHDYGPNEYGQSWFNSSTTSSSLGSFWSTHWAYLSQSGIAPVWLGEFGTTNNASDISASSPGSEGQWFQSLIGFLAANPNISWTYWALNGEDAYGLLDNRYDPTPASAAKQQALASIQAGSSSVSTICQVKPAMPTDLSATAASSSQINVTWSGQTAPTNCSVSYNVYASTTANFVPSSATLVSSGGTSTSFTATSLAAGTPYYFQISANDLAGSSPFAGPVSSATQAANVMPSIPANLTASATSSNAIQLSWQPSTTPGATYNVYSGANSDFSPNPNLRIASSVSGTSLSVSGLQPSTTYYFLVTAVIAGIESMGSNPASATTAPAMPSSAACHVIYTLNSQWSTGFNVSLSIQNLGSASISSWTLTWTWPVNQTVAQAWNSNLVQAGPTVVLTNAGWNGSVAPGGTISGVGFNGGYSGSLTSPLTFYLNGIVCH